MNKHKIKRNIKKREGETKQVKTHNTCAAPVPNNKRGKLAGYFVMVANG